VGVHALVDHVVDAQVAAAGGAHELPEAGGTNMRVGARIEGGLDVGQRDQLRRHPLLGEHLLDVRAPLAGADQAGAELVGLSELEAYVAGGGAQRRVRGALGPEREHALGLGRQTGALSRGQLLQDRRVAALGLLDAPLALARREALREANHLVHHVEAVAVVDQAAVGVDLAVDPQPEADVRLQALRPRQRLGAGVEARQQPEPGEDEDDEAEHGCETDRQRSGRT